jgi:hypothetical protein
MTKRNAWQGALFALPFSAAQAVLDPGGATETVQRRC